MTRLVSRHFVLRHTLLRPPLLFVNVDEQHAYEDKGDGECQYAEEDANPSYMVNVEEEVGEPIVAHNEVARVDERYI